MKFLKNIIGLMFLIIGINSYASDAYIENVSYSGSGCPAGSADAVLSPDNSVLSILFDNFVAIAGGGSHPSRTVKKCLLNIPVHVPDGMQVSIEKVDYRGYMFIPLMARAKFSSSYEFEYKRLNARTYRLSKQKTTFGDFDDEFFISQMINDVHLLSKCGEDFDLKLLAEIEAVSNRFNEEVVVTIDSSDTQIESRVDYTLSWKPCGGNSNGQNPNSYMNRSSGSNSTPNRDELRRLARCRRTGQC